MYEGRTDVESGKVLGHENMGQVIEVGGGVDRLKVGDWVVLPFNIGCGFCKNCEQGLTGFESMTTFAMFVPAGTPPAIVARLNREVNKALATPEVKKWLLGQGVEGVGGTPEDLAKHQAADSAKWGKVIKEHGIKLE